MENQLLWCNKAYGSNDKALWLGMKKPAVNGFENAAKPVVTRW